DADPLQLAIYRLAWAEQHGLPLSAVTAAFVRTPGGPGELPRASWRTAASHTRSWYPTPVGRPQLPFPSSHS
ncbi:hypothetical protein, partial [Streptomyces malaysiensis]|uniref:hypothetical protein n=1 Tax=Streptomyces malaysiensis TaxID=92644 RepID=UPI003D9DED53